MTHSDTEKRVRQIIAGVLNTEIPSGIDLRRDISAWDSLKHIEIIFALEEQFDVIFNEDDISRIDSIVGIVEVVE
jgi:acyl carrier protein